MIWISALFVDKCRLTALSGCSGNSYRFGEDVWDSVSREGYFLELGRAWVYMIRFPYVYVHIYTITIYYVLRFS